MSVRQTIYDTATAALLASTGINYVSREIFEDPNALKEDQYPMVRLNDGEEVRERFCYLGSTSILDMRSELMLPFVGYVRVYDRSTTGLIDARHNLLSDIEKAVVNDSTMLGLVQDVILDSEVTDFGYSEGIGSVSGSFRVTYLYNHTSP